MTKMDSYESSQGGIKQWKTRKDRSEANKLANEERATRQRTGRSRVRPGWISGSGVRTRLDARPVWEELCQCQWSCDVRICDAWRGSQPSGWLVVVTQTLADLVQDQKSVWGDIFEGHGAKRGDGEQQEWDCVSSRQEQISKDQFKLKPSEMS